MYIPIYNHNDNFRGTQKPRITSHFLEMPSTPIILSSFADAVQISWKSILKFTYNVREAYVQCLSDLGAGQNCRGAVMAFNETDRRTRYSRLFSQRIMGQAAFFAEPRKFIRNLFNQQFRDFIFHIKDIRGLVQFMKRNYSYQK